MPIAFDTSTDGGSTTATSLTYAHTVGSYNSRILFVTTRGGGGEGDKVTGITYNGTAMTKIDAETEPGDLTVVTLWYLINPDTGSNNVVVTLSSSGFIASDAASYYGAKQRGVPDNSNTATQSNNASISFGLQPNTNNSWIVIATSERVTTTAVTGVTKRQNTLFDSGGAVSDASSHSMTINGGDAGTDWATVFASFAPSGESDMFMVF